MTCSKCGAAIKKGQQFCPKCGTPVTGQQPDAVPGAEYVLRCCRWLWILLYRFGECAARLNIPCSDNKLRKILRWRIGLLSISSINFEMWVITLFALLGIAVPGLIALFLGEATFQLILIAIAAFYLSLAAINFSKAEKAMRGTLDADGHFSAIFPMRLLMFLFLLICGMPTLCSEGISSGLFWICAALILLAFTVVQRSLIRRGLLKEQAIPGWLGIFEATGEARGPEGERYVDANLSIWCEQHPEFVPIEKNCVSKYSNQCILLGDRGSPIGTQEFDHILVGPGIIIHIETKAYGGQIVVVNEDQWKRPKNNTWEFLESPYNQTRRHDMLLHSIVGNDVIVIPLICMADTNVTMSRLECAGDIDIVSLANLQQVLSEIYEHYIKQYGLNASAYQETEQLLNCLNSHKVGQVD